VSIAGHCGTGAISALARELEQAAKRGDVEEAQARFAAIGLALGDAIGALETLRRG
jgi:hypothetical protein